MNNRLKVLRAERNWSQADLAERLGVSRQTVNALERKGIVELGAVTGDGYARHVTLTAYGWLVHQQHRLIIRRTP